jgi:sugar phosphate isomerase/epimerase
MNFKGAFYEINGRDPTPEETKHALAMRRVIDAYDLDPILLMYLADTQAQAARKRGLEEVRRATGEAVDRFQAILPNIAEAEKNIGALQAVKTALERATQVARHLLGLGALIGVCVGIIWGCSLFFTWQTAYAWARSDLRAAGHQAACDNLSASIAMISARWRKRGYPQAAEDLGQSYDRSCR